MSIATKGKVDLAKFFDEGAYTTLYADANSAVTAAFGSANGQPVYAICQNGMATSVKDTQKMVKVLEMAAKTGNPAVTFYNSNGAKLEEGLDALTASAALNAAVAKLSGVVPQIAVVTGVCGAGASLAAASADVCIMSKDGELFLTAPFISEANGDKTADAGTAEFAAKAGVATITTETTDEAVSMASQLAGLLPANNLSSPALFDASAANGKYSLAKYVAVDAVKAIVDADSAVEFYAGFGKSIYTALATVGGNVVGIAATQGGENVCHICVSKLARFVRFCDAFSIPVITVINTEGFIKSSSEDVAGGIREAARAMATYADATTAKVAVITGKAVGTTFTAFANADITIAVNGCVIAPVEPTAAVTIIKKDELDNGTNIAADTAKAAAEYEKEVCSAQAAVDAGVADFAIDANNVAATVAAALDMLATKRESRMPKKHGNMAI